MKDIPDMLKLCTTLFLIFTISILNAAQVENSIAESSQSKNTNKKNTLPDYIDSKVYDVIADKTLYSYKTNKETTIKSAIDNLSFASETEILISYEDDKKKKKINSIELQLKIFRSELFSATKGSKVLTMTAKDLIYLKPMIPITVILKGEEELIVMVQKEYEKTGSIVKALAVVDSSHFSALLNVENYSFMRYYQKKRQ